MVLRRPAPAFIVSVLCILTFCGDACRAPAQKLPQRGRGAPARSVLLFLFDAAVAGHVGAYGYSRDTTPNADKLASEGFVFQNHFATAPYTVSAVASLLTSKYPPVHGVIGAGDCLRESDLTLAEYLQQGNFRTAAFVSNPWISAEAGFSRGFDEFRRYQSDAEDSHGDYHVNYDALLLDLRRLLVSSGDSRLFVLVHILLPHNPYSPPPSFQSRFCNPRYRGSLAATTATLLAVDTGQTHLDAESRERLIDLYDANLRYGDSLLGQVLAVFKETRQLAQTDVIVTADHAEAFGQHGRYLHNSTVYDEMIHVPLIVRPAADRGSVDTRRLSDTVDIFPTVLDLLGLERPPRALQGRSIFAPELAGTRKFVLSCSTGLELTALRSERSKLIQHRDGRREYYLMTSDPSESENLAANKEFRDAEMGNSQPT